MKKITKNISTMKSSKTHGKINAGTTLAKIMDKKGADKILHKNNVPCVSCPYAAMEINKLKIGDVCKMYGLNLVKILKELND
jgi:hypothetical protein